MLNSNHQQLSFFNCTGTPEPLLLCVLIFSVENLLPAARFASAGNGAGFFPAEAPAKQAAIHAMPLLLKSQELPIKVIKLNEFDDKHDIIPHWISEELKTKPLAQKPPCSTCLCTSETAPYA